MRKQNILYTSLIFTSMLLTSCSFVDVFKTTYASIEVSDARQAYLVGEVYSECNELTVIGKTRSGVETTIESKDYTISISYNLNGVATTFDGTTAFVAGGTNYKLTVTVGKLRSTIDLTVHDELVYASSVSLSGVSEIDCWESTNITLTVNPSNYNVPVTYTYSDASLVTAEKTKTGLTITAKKAGTLTITATVASSETTTVSGSHTIRIKEVVSAVKMTQTYKDYSAHHGTSSCPTTGNGKVLVLPIWFTDSNSFMTSTGKSNVKSDIEKAFFGSASDTGWQSVKSFYDYESDGALNLSGAVADWYECGKSYTYYGNDNDHSLNTCDLVTSASNNYFTKTGASRKDFDSDGDGYLDAVVLIYAAPDSSQTGFGSYQNLWAYCYWTDNTKSTANPTANVFLWASYDFMYSSDKVKERTGVNADYWNGDTKYCSIDAHTYIHEFGHILGLEDYYDYSGQYKPAGGFSMQDHNIGGHDPYSLLAYGWANAYIPTSSCTIVLDEFQNGHNVILLTPEFNSFNSPFDEYLLLELYTPTGMNKFDCDHGYQGNDAGPKAAGIRLWHIDARLTQYLGGSSYSKTLTSDATKNNVCHAMSNTYYKSKDDQSSGYLSPMGSSYYNYNILQMIRNDTLLTDYRPTTELTAIDLFYKNDSFTMNRYQKQFVGGVKLNSGSSLGWSFTVNSIDTKNGVSTATINLTRAV